MVTKEELSHKIVAKDVIKDKIITVAGQMCYEYEKRKQIIHIKFSKVMKIILVIIKLIKIN